jgi:HEAT repeat protein
LVPNFRAISLLLAPLPGYRAPVRCPLFVRLVPVKRQMRALLSAFAAAFVVVGGGATAAALDWPDTALRVDRGLAARDVVERRQAARDLGKLGAATAGPLVKKAMEDSDVEVRRSALRAAKKNHLVAVQEAAVGWLGDPDAHVRADVCEYFRSLPDKRAVAGLGRALGDGDLGVRAAAASALGASRDPDAVPPLLGKLDDPNPAVRLTVVRALGRLGDPRAVLPLAGKVQDGVIDVRREVARSLGLLGDPRASAALLVSLRDADGGVRVAAVTSIGQVRAPDAVPALELALDDRAPEVRRAAADALGAQSSEAAARTLVKFLGLKDDALATTGPSPTRIALVALGPAAIPVLIPLLEGREGIAVTRAALWVLGEIGTPEARKALAEALRRGRTPTDATLAALGHAGDENHVPLVLEYLADKRSGVREAALVAALRLVAPERPDGRVHEPVAARLGDPTITRGERLRLLRLLGRAGAARSAVLLVPVAAGKDAELALTAADALADLRGPFDDASETALLRMLNEGEPRKRLAIARALGRSGTKRALSTLLDDLDRGGDRDRGVVWTAVGGLLANYGDENAYGRVAKALTLATGPERDAILEALAHGNGGLGAARALAAPGAADDDRKAFAAVANSASGGSGDADPLLATLRTLAKDPIATVRASAVAALGARGNDGDATMLLAALADSDGAVAANAALSLGSLGRDRAGKRGDWEPKLCGALDDPRPYVRANAALALATLGATCGAAPRFAALLEDDPSPVVRARAALWARRFLNDPKVGADARAALRRCAGDEILPTVARVCVELPVPVSAPASSWTTVFVVSDDDDTPRPRTPFVLERADGTLLLGTSDRRGAVPLPTAPAGRIALLPVVGEERK